jgi:hypothetical protein
MTQHSMALPGKGQGTMQVPLPMLARFIAFTLIALVSGCGPGGGGMSGFAIEKSRGECCCVNPCKQLALVVWVDECSSASSTVGNGEFHGEFGLNDGRKVAWNCSTQDGKTGRVEIAGTPFDLATGGIFLISTKEGATKVEQLPIETVGSEYSGARERLERLAKTDPKFMAFVNSAKDK